MFLSKKGGPKMSLYSCLVFRLVFGTSNQKKSYFLSYVNIILHIQYTLTIYNIHLAIVHSIDKADGIMLYYKDWLRRRAASVVVRSTYNIYRYNGRIPLLPFHHTPAISTMYIGIFYVYTKKAGSGNWT